ncbi:NUDIX domain-containing protein [Nocardioides sp. SOB77]|uniref:8-oxo-dGTP diphosphatase n=1 Tax=Nocardioides oceani TaxID=3058369 RepID=A0ABT8FK54_9ACTN|nr:NUDIX domain-containing protein [Nocardioides oceani]MDN4175063.1 NUDIX domain-containing protein [Nocardioides oceani]
MHEVVVGALVRGGRVLLAHRRPDKRAFPGVWDLPGGLVEGSEPELEALARELHEELGVRIETGAASPLCRVVVRATDEPALLSAWLVPAWRGTAVNVAPEEHDGLGWFGATELPAFAHALVRSSVLDALDARGEHRG